MEYMSIEFEMSLVGEWTYFLGLQDKQIGNRTFISQSKYARNLVKIFGLETTIHHRTPIGTHAKSLEMKEVRSMIGNLLYLTAN